MTAYRPANQGAKRLVQECMGLSKGQTLMILVDETAIELASQIIEAADQIGVSSTAIFIPVSSQRRIPHLKDLSLITLAAAKEARAILACVNDSPQCLLFRQRLLQTCWSARTRLGVMPGATLDVLELANVDLEELALECERLEHILARGQVLEFLSVAQDGQTHLLKADIGGWERLPVASDGIIQDGAWGNVPSGEVYIAPVEFSGEGSIVINGSVPGKVIAPGEEVVLYFEHGKLVKFEPPGSAAALWLEQTQFQPAIQRGDENWGCLGEIGIGLNTGGQGLSGNMMCDEKLAGTAHIALGWNRFMGGEIEATIHCDLVVHRPTILVDGVEILRSGRLQYAEEVWRVNYSRMSLNGYPASTSLETALSGIQTRRLADGRLKRTLRSGNGRVSSCFIGDDQTAALAGRLHAVLPQDGGWSTIEWLAQRAGLNEETARRALHVMWQYDLIRMR